MSADPLSIYQAWLDTVSEAMLTLDLDVLAEHMSLPYLHRSHDTRMVIETRRDMEIGYRSVAQTLRSQGANKFIRLASSAEYLSDDYIQGIHVAHAMRNATPVIPSYTNRGVIRRGPTCWKLIEIDHGFAHGAWPIHVINVPDEAQRPAAAEDDARRQAAEPLALYQRFLNAFTRANVDDDFEAFVDLCDFPYSWHTVGEDHTASGPEDARAFFCYISQVLRDHGIEEFLRLGEHAEFLSGNIICGYHTTRFMRDGRDAVEPIKARMMLRRIGTRWKLHSVTNAMADGDYPNQDPTPVNELVTYREIQQRTKQ